MTKKNRKILYSSFALIFFIATFLSTFSPALAESSSTPKFKIETIATDLDFPWAITEIDQGSFLITEKPGKLIHINNKGEKNEITGLPENLVARRQGGLLGIALHPDFNSNSLIYFSYVGRGMGGTGTEVARAKLKNNHLEDLETIFIAKPKIRSDVHFGSRLAFLSDGTLLVSLGERFKMDEAQNKKSHLGSIIRINDDGSVPQDNPFLNDADAEPEIFSIGHRNVQGLVYDNKNDLIWSHEHGPKGGDELNIINSGENYGWPEISYGIDYDGTIITDKTHMPGMKQPEVYWVPSIAPCGLTLYNGKSFPEWQGNLFLGALAGTHLRRLVIKNQKVIEQEILLEDLGERIRDVHTGKDGSLYFITDSHEGRLMRLVPSQPSR
jgi:glucose/arabinose dehydrogenase